MTATAQGGWLTWVMKNSWLVFFFFFLQWNENWGRKVSLKHFKALRIFFIDVIVFCICNCMSLSFPLSPSFFVCVFLCVCVYVWCLNNLVIQTSAHESMMKDDEGKGLVTEYMPKAHLFQAFWVSFCRAEMKPSTGHYLDPVPTAQLLFPGLMRLSYKSIINWIISNVLSSFSRFGFWF